MAMDPQITKYWLKIRVRVRIKVRVGGRGGVHDISSLNISLDSFQSTHMSCSSVSLHFLFLVIFLVASLYIFNRPITILEIVEVFDCIIVCWFEFWFISIVLCKIRPTASRQSLPRSIYTWGIIKAYWLYYCLIWEVD